MSKENQQNPYTSPANGASNGHSYRGGEYYSGEAMPIQNGIAENEEIDLRYLFNLTMRYKWWVLSITILLTFLAGLYAYSLQDIYTSNGTIVIAQERNQYSWAGTDISSIISNSYGVGTGNRLVNEIQVFQSRKLADEIAEKVLYREVMDDGSRFPILWREYPEDSTLVSISALAGRIRSDMRVSQVGMETDILEINYSSPSPEEAAYLVNTTIDTYTEVSAQQKRMAANNALQFLEEELNSAEADLEQSEQNLEDYMSRTELVQIDGQTNAVIQRIAELESQRQQVQVSKVAVNESILANERQLNDIRPGLAEQFADNISSSITRTQARLSELELERDLLLQNNPSLRTNPELEPQLVELQDNIDQTKQRINELASELINDESDIYIGFLDNEDGGVTGRIVSLRQELIQLRIELSQLEAQENALTEQLEEENAFFDDLPQNMIELVRLRRENQVNENMYQTISEQYTQTNLWEQTQFGAGRPLDYAIVPGASSGPNRTRYIMIGFLLGGMLSVGFVFVRENISTVIDGTDKVRKTGYPLLASIPANTQHIRDKFKGESYVTVQGRRVSTSWTAFIDSVNPIAESYRRLHNNIIYSDPDKEMKTILVTSSKKGEGKTTVSMNLAVALAESGKKVLVMDIDLRRPNVHRFAGEDRVPGIIEVFYDNKSLSEGIRPSVAPGVDLLTAGANVPNPAAVTQSKKLMSLLSDVKEQYDHVIVDTPPFGVITDAASIVKMADAVVVALRFGVTKTNELNHTFENLNRINAQIAGTVITSFKFKQSSDYYYTSRYSYYDSYAAYEEYQEDDRG